MIVYCLLKSRSAICSLCFNSYRSPYRVSLYLTFIIFASQGAGEHFGGEFRFSGDYETKPSSERRTDFQVHATRNFPEALFAESASQAASAGHSAVQCGDERGERRQQWRKRWG